MAFYRAIWLSVTGVLVIAGVAAAIVSLPWQGLLGLALLAVFVGPFIGAAIHPQFYENTAIPIYLLQATTVAIVGAIAAAGLIALSTVVALPHRAARRVFPTSAAKNAGPGTLVDETPTGNRGGRPAAASVPSDLPAARTAADTVLPLARRRGAVLAVAVAHQLHRPAAHRLSDQRLYLVELRSALLNELAQRNPQGFTLWLNSGAHAASDPARYFSSVHYSPHSAPTAPTSRPSNVIRR